MFTVVRKPAPPAKPVEPEPARDRRRGRLWGNPADMPKRHNKRALALAQAFQAPFSTQETDHDGRDPED